MTESKYEHLVAVAERQHARDADRPGVSVASLRADTNGRATVRHGGTRQMRAHRSLGDSNP
jgi:hypothetical protein